MNDATILIVGTYDTKQDELNYIAQRIVDQGGKIKTMDVSVLGQTSVACDINKHAVAEAAGSSIQAAIDSGDENTAMQIMAKGASNTTAKLHNNSEIHGVLCLLYTSDAADE